jgi:small-conductance mechanosensitive channel/CRP-like cAMP-binding protein
LEFLFNLAQEGARDLSFILLAAAFLVALLARYGAPEEKLRLRKLLALIPLHLLLVLLAALFQEEGSKLYRNFRISAMVLSGAALICLADVLLFGILLGLRKIKLPMIIRHVLLAAFSLLYLVFLFSYFNVDFTGVVATSAVLTMVIGLSLQDTLGNVIGGMALQFDKAIQVGDWIRLGEVSGQVSEITWRSTSVETSRWHTVVIPNSNILRGQVAVVGRRKGKPLYERREITFNVGLETPPADVIRVMNEGIQKDAFMNVATDPKPNCIVVDLSKDVGNYVIRYYLTALADDMPTDSMMRTKLYFILKRAGIPLNTASQSVYVTNVSEEAAQEQSAGEQRRRLDALSEVHLFDGLSESERQLLAREMGNAPFAKGEILTKQGTEAHWLYIIVKGDVSVRVEKDGVEAEVARLGAGDFFGEMSLMTGEKRAATVLALSEVDCLRLDKEAFQELVKARPPLAEGVAGLIAARKVALLAQREGLDQEAMQRRLAESKEDLLGKILSFFSA